MSAPKWRPNLAMLSYATGFTIPKVATPWLLRTRMGILLLIPAQVLMTCFITVPCIFMELALGQYSDKATIHVWDLCPVLRGIGLCSFVTFLVYQAYYSFMCTCTLCFTFLSFTNDQRWKSCNNSWNKINCYTLRDNYTRRLECSQKLSKEKCDKMQWQSSIEQFYFNRILNMEAEPSGYVGPPQQELLVYAVVTTVVVFFANWGGPKSTDKPLIILTVVATIQLIVLFFLPLKINNASVILSSILKQFNKRPLGEWESWSTIIDLALSTPGLGFGAYVTFGTHSAFRNPLHLKAIVIGLVNILFTVLYSVTVQNFLISLCLQNKMLMDDFVSLEQELTMPEAVFFLEHTGKFWIYMWLSNTYVLGLRSLIVMMTLNGEVLYNSIPQARERHNFCILFFCILIYISGVFFSTKKGYLLLKTIEEFINRFWLLLLNTLQLIGIVYIYGMRRFRDDIHFMLGIKSSAYFLAIYILDPLLLGSVLAYRVYEFYPNFHFFENFLLWLIPALVLVYSLAYIFASCVKKDARFWRAGPGWGPRHPELATSRNMFRAYNIAKEYLSRRGRFRQEYEESEV